MTPDAHLLSHALQLIQQSLHDCLPDDPILLWQLDPVRNKLKFFSEPIFQTLGLNVPLLFQNGEYLDRTVLEDDHAALRDALDKMKMQRHTGVFFRIRDNDGCLRWLIMLGMPAPETPFSYIGVIGRCTRMLRRVMGEQHGIPPESMDWLSSPAMLVSFSSWKIIHANRSARELCGQNENTPLEDIFAISEDLKIAIYESLTFSHRWQGILRVRKPGGSPLPCSVMMRPLSQDGHHCLWIRLTPLLAVDPAISEAREETPLPALSAASGERDLLRLILRDPQILPAAEGIILSRIFPEENRVSVTCEGAMFTNSMQHADFPYVGSIAENIARFGLNSLTVDETSRSIRPIDWALFIPQGVRSYYAEPWFEQNGIRLVLIFCSPRGGAFSDVRGASLRKLVDAFARRLHELDAGQMP